MKQKGKKKRRKENDVWKGKGWILVARLTLLFLFQLGKGLPIQSAKKQKTKTKIFYFLFFNFFDYLLLCDFLTFRFSKKEQFLKRVCFSKLLTVFCLLLFLFFLGEYKKQPKLNCFQLRTRKVEFNIDEFIPSKKSSQEEEARCGCWYDGVVWVVGAVRSETTFARTTTNKQTNNNHIKPSTKKK